ncbi:hypothetical protein BB560_003340 [Smittium megazygosporum]|uniref:Extracellular membrane protein CFEM domain-containing protein n=1 Tax=Smittium megazygosporum TaxID=133381 RepID=A0A2T9ZC89_9FUNG|nr:hypothetical protein BB560_003340 [Smittium megazygosporum]
MNKVFQFVLFFVALFAVKAVAECADEDNFSACIKYIHENKPLYCNTTDYECQCRWDTHMVTCFSVCEGDESKASALSAVQLAANKTCQAFLDWTNTFPKPNRTLTEDDPTPTSDVVGNGKARNVETKIKAKSSASIFAVPVHAVFSVSALASVLVVALL